jgi:hypothetical protein
VLSVLNLSFNEGLEIRGRSDPEDDDITGTCIFKPVLLLSPEVKTFPLL